MDYISLNNLSNKYPSGSILNPTASVLVAYSTIEDDNNDKIIRFAGNSDENTILFNTTSSIQLKDINVVEDTTIKFIIEYGIDEDDTLPKYYTSEPYYDLLVSASLENNPYYSDVILKNETPILKIFYGEYINRISNKIKNDINRGITFKLKYVFKITGDDNPIEVDFKAYTNYIDWVVSGESSQYSYKNYPIDLISKYNVNTGSLSDIEITDGNQVSDSISKTINQIITNRISGVNKNISDLQRQVQLLIQNQQ